MKKVHLKIEEEIIKCGMCDFSTIWRKNFLRHYSFKHGENRNKVLRCEKCDYSTNDHRNLNAHLKSVGLYNFPTFTSSWRPWLLSILRHQSSRINICYEVTFQSWVDIRFELIFWIFPLLSSNEVEASSRQPISVLEF